MSNLTKRLTKREEINTYEAMKKAFPKILVKDLTKNERICPVCNGLGIRVEDNMYGIMGDTSEEKIKIDAYDIVRDACEDLHEDAMDNISYEDITRLQNFLDEWCKEQTGTTTYYPCYEQYVLINWSEHLEERR